MSWMHQRDSTNSNADPSMYDPSQHSGANNQWQSANSQNWYNPTSQHQDLWQQPPQQYVAGQNHPQAVDNQPVTHFQYNQPQSEPFHQNVGPYDQQQVYSSPSNNQPYGQTNTYVPPTQQQQQPPQPTEDSWNNWDSWADEENLNSALAAQQQGGSNLRPANNLGDSFSNDQSWNWSVQGNEQAGSQTQPALVQNAQNAHPSVVPHQPLENKILKIRGKLDTPQWSTESQPSQESSDDVLHTSESDKSHMVSRSSTISHSPLSGQDFLPPPQIPKLVDVAGEVENKEIISSSQQKVESVPPPPRPTVQATPPLMQPPPPGNPEGASKNPYKRITGLSHKAANNFRTSSITPPESRQPFIPSNIPSSQPGNLETLPDNSEHPDHTGVKASSSLQPWTENNEVPINDRNQYLETGQLSQANSVEGGDMLPPPGLQRMVPGQLEQDRTAAGTQNDSFPGFSRMVLGQTENSPGLSSQDTQVIFDPSGPPEGLHRMVPGESSSPETSMLQTRTNENDSEIELSQISSAQFVAQPRSATIGADTPPAVQNMPTPLRSGSTSIPPNRSETIGGDDSHDVTLQPSVDNVHVRGASVSSIEAESRISKPTNGSITKEKSRSEQQGTRRKYMEGHSDDSNTVSGLTNSIRNLTVGENPSDGHPSSGSLPDHRTRRHSREESSDSEQDSKLQSKLSLRDPREKRSEKSKAERDRHRDQDLDRDKYRDRDKGRERDSGKYSPDPYRNKRDPRRSRKRDPQYDEDNDYYSDKEKDRKPRDDRDRDYNERKYSSLRKEKERRRKDRDGRDSRDVRDYKEPRRRGEYYYNRYGEDRGYPDETRSSRPSSRSDSMHEVYRERRHEADHREKRHRDKDKERDQYRPRGQREAFNPYQNYQYDPYNQYQQQYQYYENLRRMNPQAYAEWYRRYYQQVAGGSNTSFTGDDRASVHSGRSSANDELAKDSSLKPGLNSTDFEDQTVSSQRLTPNKFSTPHIKGSIASGKLIQVLPNYPLDGQPAVIEVVNLQYLLENDQQYIELSSFPGPLCKGLTHKKTIIEYCDNKIRKAVCNNKINDIDSYILMWELLILLIRQNGMVVGTDIAELLLKNCNNLESTARPSSVISNTSSINQLSEASNSNLPDELSGSRVSLKEEEVTKKFRDYLLYGSDKEALEWAMKHGLWGHALFLASKLDKRTYANVMMRFANGLAINDPLQTLYQLLSGKIPAAVTCVSDEKWGDWRSHLAMIISNSTERPELHRRAITILGDTLLTRGNLYAAQFCYLMAEVGFGAHDNSETRLVLLGCDHRANAYPQFVTNEAVHMTEIYEYACSLNDQGFIIAEFQMYKYIVASRLADFGLLEKSLAYLEKLAGYITASPQDVSSCFVDNVCSLADKLKFYDPVGDEEDESKFGGLMETNRPDNSWLKDLKHVQVAFQTGQIAQDTIDDNMGYEQPQMLDPSLQPSQNSSWDLPQYDQHHQYDQQQPYHENVPSLNLPQGQLVAQTEYQEMAPPQSSEFANTFQEQQSLYGGEQQQFSAWGDNHLAQEGPTADQFDAEGTNSYNDSTYRNNNVEDISLQTQPQISMPNQQKFSSAYSDEPLPHEIRQQSKAEKPKQESNSPKKETKQSTGWFGGIFSKLSMKPKNQMKLPEDKNPKIVWDQEKKRWINVDEDSNDPANEFKPPPKMSDLMPKLNPQQPPTMTVSGGLPQGIPQGAPIPTFNPTMHNGSQILQANGSGTGPASLPAQSEDGVGPPKANMFKLQRGRNLKNSYVDVFHPSGNTATASSGPSSLLNTESKMAPQMNFFIPAPVTDPNAPVDFLTPAPPMQVGQPPQDS